MRFQYTEIHLNNIPVEAEQPVVVPANITQSNWKSTLWRIFIIVLFLLFIIMGIGHLITNHATGDKFNLSVLITHFVYQVMIAVTAVLFVIYLYLGRVNTTIIPCKYTPPSQAQSAQNLQNKNKNLNAIFPPETAPYNREGRCQSISKFLNIPQIRPHPKPKLSSTTSTYQY